MDGPDLGFREAIGAPGLQARDLADEEDLERVLEEIEDAIRRDIEQGPPSEAMSEEDAWNELAAIESWAGVASNAAARFYAPASPWPHNVAGWGKKAVAPHDSQRPTRGYSRFNNRCSRSYAACDRRSIRPKP